MRTTNASELPCQVQLIAGVCSIGTYSSGSASTPQELTHVADDSDDFAPRRRCLVGTAGDSLAHRLIVRPQPLRERLVDDDDMWRPLAVSAREQSACVHRCTHRLEESCRHDVKVRIRLVSGRVRLAFDFDFHARSISGERWRAVRRRRDDVWHLADSIDEVQKVSLNDGRRWIARRRERHARRDQSVRGEADVHLVELSCTSHEQAGAGEQRQRQCDFGNHKNASQPVSRCRRAARPAAGTRIPARRSADLETPERAQDLTRPRAR